MGDAFRHLRRPDPPLRTERLLLRAWTADDAPALAAAWADPEIARWTSVPAVEDRVATATRWIARTPKTVDLDLSLDLVVEHERVVVGEVGLVYLDRGSEADARVELGWWVASAHRGRGIASEAVACFTAFVLSGAGLGFGAAHAVCDDGNPASGAVARNAGFVPCDRPAPAGSTTWTRVGPVPPPGTVHT